MPIISWGATSHLRLSLLNPHLVQVTSKDMRNVSLLICEYDSFLIHIHLGQANRLQWNFVTDTCTANCVCQTLIQALTNFQLLNWESALMNYLQGKACLGIKFVSCNHLLLYNHGTITLTIVLEYTNIISQVKIGELIFLRRGGLPFVHQLTVAKEKVLGTGEILADLIETYFALNQQPLGLVL